MASKTYRTPAQFAREFRRDINRMAGALTAAYHEENHREAKRLLVAETPRASGKLADGYVDLVEGRKASPSTIRNSKKRGIASSIGNSAAHFHAVDWGRRPYKGKRSRGAGGRFKKAGAGRIGGSTDASRGMTKPASEKLQNGARQTRLRARAIKHAESKLK